MPQSKREAHFQAVEAYIRKNYVSNEVPSIATVLGGILRGNKSAPLGMDRGMTVSSELELKGVLDAIMQVAEDTFAERLIFLMEESGKAPAEIYVKAGITKQHFSKIKNHSDYKPTKETALAFAVALHLSLPETKDLIGRAGFTLSRSSKRDLIVEYFIKEKIYDVDEINYNLDVRGLGTLTNRRNGL